MEAPAEKSAQATARAEKKAARRAAFIQEVAAAVALVVCGPPSPSRGPFAEAFYQEDIAQYRASKVWGEEREALRWAIKKGLLPASSTELPSEELQCHLLEQAASRLSTSLPPVS